MAAPRVGVIGARRRRRGLGPFVVRDLKAAGAQVPCFLATSPETRDLAEAILATAGCSARGYVELDAMLADHELDALAICAPAEVHAQYLDAALAAGLHVLCEKPFVWGCAGVARAAARRIDAFAAGELLLAENCPWPYTLPAYERLHPGAFDSPPRAFEMHLKPAARGVNMLADSLPHALSLLQAVVPGESAAAAELAFSAEDGTDERICVEFLYRTPAAAARVCLRLARTEAHPRETAIAFDGRIAHRRVEPRSYRLSFHDDDSRSVALPDPMTALIGNFVDALRAPNSADAAARRREIGERMRLLEEITGAFADSGIPR